MFRLKTAMVIDITVAVLIIAEKEAVEEDLYYVSSVV